MNSVVSMGVALLMLLLGKLGKVAEVSPEVVNSLTLGSWGRVSTFN